MQATDFDRAGQAHRHRHRLRAGGNEVLKQHAQDGADGETRQQQRRTARPAHRAEGDAFHQEHQHDRDDQGEDDGKAERQAKEERKTQAVSGSRHQLAMREIDEAHDREDHGEAERKQRIGTAEAKRIDQLLQEHVHGWFSFLPVTRRDRRPGFLWNCADRPPDLRARCGRSP